MQKVLKNSLFKEIILLENIVLFLSTTISIVLFLCNISVGYSIFLISNYILYPLILFSFVIGIALKIMKISEYKLELVLFGANLAVSLICFFALLYRFAGVLESF